MGNTSRQRAQRLPETPVSPRLALVPRGELRFRIPPQITVKSASDGLGFRLRFGLTGGSSLVSSLVSSHRQLHSSTGSSGVVTFSPTESSAAQAPVHRHRREPPTAIGVLSIHPDGEKAYQKNENSDVALGFSTRHGHRKATPPLAVAETRQTSRRHRSTAVTVINDQQQGGSRPLLRPAIGAQSVLTYCVARWLRTGGVSNQQCVLQQWTRQDGHLSGKGYR